LNAELETVPRDAPGVVRRLDDGSGHCYLTFDDGPHPDWTPRVLDVLARADVRATFFVIGRLAQQSPALLREIRAAGHVIGNHGYSHRHPWTLTRARARSEVRAALDTIAQVLGERPQWFRPPHGRLGAYLVEAAREEGQRVALWSVSAVDWGPLATRERIQARLGALRAGDIVLMHDGPLRHNRPDRTLQVLPSLLAALTRDGPAPAPLPLVATMAS
jgi:peptidoglycan/xylan/chitin deacetylase (PgdA/CDA1 family)